MTQDSGARPGDENANAEPKGASDPLTQPPRNPFLLVPNEGAEGSGPASDDVLARVARVLTAAKGDGALLGPVRTVTAAWLEPDGWQIGLGLLRASDGTVSAAALAVADREVAEDWRGAVRDSAADQLERLLVDGERPLDASRLPPLMARLAASQGLEAVDPFPIDAAGKVLGAVILLRGQNDQPAPTVRQGMQISRGILCQMASRVRAQAAVSGAARHVKELTARLEPTEGRVTDAERRYALVCRGAEAGLWDWDLESDELHLSARWKAILGFGSQELTQQPSEWFDRIHPDDADRVELELLEHLDGGSPRFESEHRLQHSDGTHRWVRVRGVAERGQNGRAARIAGSMVDLTDTRSRDDRTARDFMYNRLTGFPTGAMLNDRIEQAMRRRVRRPDRAFAVLTLALEGLRETSEEVGSEATEELLLSIGRRIASAMRPGDTVAHMDDLDFGVVLDDVKSLDDAVRVAERIAGGLSQAIPLGSTSLSFKPAIGLSLSRTAYETPEEMIRDARIALRRARRDETTIQVFDAATKAYAQSISELEGDLREAFETRELFLEYQPVVSLSDGRITGVEAFLRWNHPERGPISPAEFIPVAEEAGLLFELGYWVVDRACRQMREWIDSLNLRFPPNVAINVAESQLFEESFVPRILETIEGSKLEPKLVRIDVSEGTFMKDGPAAGRILKALSQRGVRIAVDDFGTGYSSLSYLHRYPIGALKIDRSFVSGTAGTSNEWDVARTIIELAKILELEVIAEGIENREQFQRLRALGCQQAQGFFFSGPVPAAKAGKLIAEGYPLDLTSVSG